LAREIASVLYFNKMSHKSYEDDDLTAAFGDFWSAFGSSNVKTLLLQSLPDVRKKYIQLFTHTIEDVSGHSESLEVQADNHLFQRCIFIAVWELQIRMEPATAPTVDVEQLLDFLVKVLAINTKQLDWGYTTPKIKQILLRLAAKDDFKVTGDHLERLVEGLVTACSAFPMDIKTKALREVAREFSQEKHDHVYGRAVVEIYKRDTTKLPLFPLLFALEDTIETDPNQPEIEALMKEVLGGLDDPTEDLVKQLTEYGNCETLKIMLSDQIIQKAESMEKLLQNDLKKPLVESLITFAQPLLVPKLIETHRDDSPRGEAIGALLSLLQPPPAPEDTTPEVEGTPSPNPQAD
jgi:hypothetical protein